MPTCPARADGRVVRLVAGQALPDLERVGVDNVGPVVLTLAAVVEPLGEHLDVDFDLNQTAANPVRPVKTPQRQHPRHHW